MISKNVGDKLMVRCFALLLSGALFTALSVADTSPASNPEPEEPELTPVGAERAGNEAGTIPAWDGGLRGPIPGYRPGKRLADPFADDPVLFTITAANQQMYAEYLSDGQKAMLTQYPDSWHMNVYASRRSASYPDYVYDAFKTNAATATLIAEGRGGVENSIVTSPFPHPKQGVEVIWNHNLRWHGIHIIRTDGMVAVTRRGNYTLILQDEEWAIPYARRRDSEASALYPNLLLAFKQKVFAPGFITGSGTLVHEFLNMNIAQRETWIYSPNLRRVLRMPFSGNDTPASNSDSLTFNDEGDMFNGSPSLFTWTLLGKREMYIPYNAYRLHSDEFEADDILEKNHINPDHARYELHRVWVVEGKLKKSQRHQYSRRVFYVDEDSWQIAAADNYDTSGKLWRVSEGHMINFYHVPAPWYTLRVFQDLKARRYLVRGLDNQRRAPRFDDDINPRLFGPNALAFYVR
ncbi:MAG TPA: DUF1329 domain-containing protein [Halieaceae bacterium]|nr:DUF1329 domain-containing protein [Halieaceae bacterium]